MFVAAWMVFIAGNVQAQEAQQTPPAVEPDEEAIREARALFELAHAHYDAGRFQEAVQEFRRAYELTRRPELLYNLYLAYRDSGDETHAVEALRRYLSDAADITPTQRRSLERRLAALEAASGAPHLDDPADPDEPDPDPPEVSSQPAHVSSGGEGFPILPGVITLGVGGAAVLFAAIEGIVAQVTLSQRDGVCVLGASHLDCPADYDQQSIVDTFNMHRDIGYAFLTGGLVVAAVGAVLLGFGATDDTPVQVSAGCSDTGCGALVRGAL